MVQTEKELELLKDSLSEMWLLVISQLEKAKIAFLNNDKEIASEINRKEKKIDAFELKIDTDCENYIVLYAPKAIDMRLVLSIMKINMTLERIADFSNSIAKYILIGGREKLSNELLNEIEIETMFNELLDMFNKCYKSFQNEDITFANQNISQDDEIDRIYYKSPDILANYTQLNPDIARETIRFIIILKKLERIGDHCNNIIEELVFYVEAKVLKHSVEK